MGDAEESQKDNYLLLRGGIASARLTGQHYIITERQGWILHPSIQNHIADRADLKVADLATGNGIWAISLSKTYPSAEITGLDISSTQFPAPFTRPAHVNFETYNIFDPVPAKYHAYFDVIHIRLIVAALHDRNTDTLLANLSTMLKPGGYLQWDENIHPATLRVDDALHTSAIVPSYLRRIYAVTPLRAALEWCGQIPQELARNGFTDVVTRKPDFSPELVQYETELMFWVMQELIQSVRNLPGDGIKEEMDRAAQELQADVDSGTHFVYNWEVVVGRKPS